jgi:hypothetical protein
MLGKLLKYELKAMGRIILPLYLVLILASALFAVNIKLNDKTQSLSGFMNIISIVTTILFVACIFVVVIVMFFLVVQRFYKNLLGQEGYLMFTLPASTLSHILSKLLSSLIWIVIGLFAGCSAGFLMVVIISDMKTFNEFISEIMWNLDSLIGSGSIVKQLGMAVVILILGIMKSLSEIYASMAVGHQFGSHRGLWSILAYIGFSLIELGISYLPFVKKITVQLTEQGGFLYNEQFHGTFAIAVLFSLIGILIYGAITWRLLDRRLNLE